MSRGHGRWPMNWYTAFGVTAGVFAYGLLVAQGNAPGLFAASNTCARNVVIDGIIIWCVVWLLLSGIRAILRQRYVPKVLLVLVCGIPALAGVIGYSLPDVVSPRITAALRAVPVTETMLFHLEHGRFYLEHTPWILGFIAAGVLGLVNFNIQRSLRELGANVCHQCEYDLTGNVSGICPECGTKISSRSKRG